ncbi:MAG: sodium:calcium antiporter [Candidatus Altiarchaeota archaeon]|nr:sodium:calcium antiporter [Candidatus Altiarchaeota archaeon]
MLPSILIFLLSLGVLVIASRWVIAASIKIAEYFKIAELALGFLLIAFATSFPDFIVSTTASYEGMGGIALGDVLGSSIANICLVLGAAALIRTIHIKREQTLESAELLLLITLIPLILLTREEIGRPEGLILIIVFLFYALFAIKEKFTMGLKEGVTKKEWSRAVVMFVIGIALTLVSAHFIIGSASDMARILGVSEALIGMTIVAFGTTLPELAIDFTAIRTGHSALAIGDIFGSCVINLTLVLGAAALINPLSNGVMVFTTAITFLVGVNIFLWYILMKHEGITKRYGLMLLLAYIIFIEVETIWAFNAG